MISVLRIGHRKQRDKRITTHVALVARAFGADSIMISEPDEKIVEGVHSVSERFGGRFNVSTTNSYSKYLKNFDGVKVHLTMYGEALDDAMPKIPHDRDVLVVVGAEKVPGFVYDYADFNVAVGNQPHSEVAALALFLDRYNHTMEFRRKFPGLFRVIPNADGKSAYAYSDDESYIEFMRSVNVPENVIEHSIAVKELAMKMIGNSPADTELVRVGALLHDIGRSRTHGIAHAVAGAELLTLNGFPPGVVRVVERHIGAGIYAREAKELGLPPVDYVPETIEEKIVAHADNLITGTKKVPLKTALERFPAALHARILRLHEELKERTGVDSDML